MSLPITAVGPLNVETNPILTEFAAIAGVASARAVAPASQNAVLIFPSLLTIYVCRQSSDPSVSPLWEMCFVRETVGWQQARTAGSLLEPSAHAHASVACTIIRTAREWQEL